ncbi:MAG: DAK2 domain-containing protein [Chloroflexota bacterium]
MQKETASSSASLREQFNEKPIDGLILRNLAEAGLSWLRVHQDIVNSLNVFPVPDGDTGTNMVLTMQAAIDEVNNSNERNFGKMAHILAHGALMGARGNSGVILSQIWRGFARALDEQQTLDSKSFVRGLVEARNTAYKGVVRPVEGTILTVAKDIASAAEQALQHTNDIIEILEEVVLAADKSVERTPTLLPVLKEAGVVDSGGIGLFFIFEGMLRHIDGQPLDVDVATVQPLSAMVLENTLESIEPGQDYEVVVDFRPHGELDFEGFYNDLDRMGTSIQIGEGDGMYRMHIHVPTEKRYEPIEYSMSLGTIMKVSIENLIVQMEELKKVKESPALSLTKVEPGQIAVVAVSPGPGLSRVFGSLGAAGIVEGGQTMNPSTQDILNALDPISTDKIIILPNNKNIIMTAQSVKDLTVKQIAVVPSKTIPQGICAMLSLAPDSNLDEVAREMQAAMDEVCSGEITTATRDVKINGVVVKKDQIIGLLNGSLVVSASSIEKACLDLLEKANAAEYELITLYYGVDLDQQEANRIADVVRETYPEQEVECHDGGQPHYFFIMSLE